MKKLVTLVVMMLGLGVMVGGTTFVKATDGQEEEVLAEEVQEVKEVQSFELFWPVVAGRTKGNSMYFLKRLKENVRGALIFGQLEKADYYSFLATKRLVEAESLLDMGEQDKGKESLDEVVVNLEQAEEKVKSAKESGVEMGSVGANIVKQVTNIETFVLWYRTQDKVDGQYFDVIISRVGMVRDII